MKRRVIFLGVLLLALFGIFGCAGGEKKEEQAAKKPEQSDGRETEEKEPFEAEKPSEDLAAPSNAGALHVDGTRLCGSDGNPVQLKGISTHGLAWFPGYVNEECFGELRREWKANVIRLAMYTAESGGYCTDGDKEALKKLVRDGVAYAKSQDLYEIGRAHV